MYNESHIYFIYSSFFLYCLCMHSRTPLNNNTLDDIGKQTHTDNVALVFKTINAIDTGNWLCYIEGTDAKRSFRMVVNGKLQSLFFHCTSTSIYIYQMCSVGYPQTIFVVYTNTNIFF